MRYAMCVEYDGSEFAGWQRQTHSPSVQTEVERSLSRVANHQITVICAGRTDTGIHARGQVVHFDTGSERSDRQWMLGINSHLPASIRVVWIKAVEDDFHARFGAFSRSYQYRIMNRWVRPAIGHQYYGWCREWLDDKQMHEATRPLLGQHDFSAFQSAGCSAHHAVREISEIAVRRQDDVVLVDITANAFLYHMVRNIVGSLISVGLGEKPSGWIKEVLEGRDRKLAGVMAESNGLCFMGVRYDPKYNLPATPAAFPFSNRKRQK